MVFHNKHERDKKSKQSAKVYIDSWESDAIVQNDINTQVYKYKATKVYGNKNIKSLSPSFLFPHYAYAY